MYQQKCPIYRNSKAVRDMVLLLMASYMVGRTDERYYVLTIDACGQALRVRAGTKNSRPVGFLR